MQETHDISKRIHKLISSRCLFCSFALFAPVLSPPLPGSPFDPKQERTMLLRTPRRIPTSVRTPRDRRGPLHAGRRASVIYFSLLSPLLSSLVFCLGVVAFIHLYSFLMRSQVIPRMSTLLSCCHHEKPLGPFTLDVAPVVSSFCSLLSFFSFLFFSFLLLASSFSLALSPYSSLSRKEALDNIGSSGVPPHQVHSIPFQCHQIF